MPWHSNVLGATAKAAPWLRVPLPDDYLAGFDWQAHESDSGSVPTFVFGRLTRDRVPYYYPLALAIKWPLAFLLLLGLRAWSRRGRPRRLDTIALLVPAALFLLAGMTLVKLNAGIRYMFPLLPLLAIWLGATLRLPMRRAPDAGTLRVASLAAALVVVLAVESAVAAPYWLSSFNLLVGGPGRGDGIVNDSNVDWGQGLIALRDEMRARGITRVLLTYHGSEDPGVYGIDYVPVRRRLRAARHPVARGEQLLLSRAAAADGDDVRHLRHQDDRLQRALEPAPDARPANCMYLYRLGVQ